MGASKKLMEELIMAYADRLPIKTARFANVAFSNGSLPLGFLKRLNKNQPWSCPLGIRRFFVSPQESGELCLIASVMGESGDIFFPKLDEERDMIPFDQIARDLLHELGYTPDICQSEAEAKEKTRGRGDEGAKGRGGELATWPIYFFGSDTDGEKSFEEFFTETEQLDNDSFVNLGVVKNSKKRSIHEINAIFDRLHQLFASRNVTKAGIVEILKIYLPNFEHIETGKGLDSKM
jgi:FlaA1/EpsC-like NDP-sugar epimerase